MPIRPLERANLADEQEVEGLAAHPLDLFRGCVDEGDLHRERWPWLLAQLEGCGHALGSWRNRQLRGVVGWRPMPWESEIFGLSMGKVSPFLAAVEPKSILHTELLDGILEHSDAAGVEHLLCRAPTDDL